MMTISEVARYLAGKDDFVIMTHRRPDGDTVGSAAFLCRGLRQLGKRAYVLENPEVTEKYLPLLQGLTKKICEPGDTLVSVDVAAPEMVGAYFAHLTHRIDLRIDHHRSAGSFAANELVDPTAAACGEIIYEILDRLSVKPDKEMAEALYTAVSTDTGCFRYANTTAHSFYVAHVCASISDRLFQINQQLFETNSLAKLRLQGWMAENARFLQNGQVAVCAIPQELEQQLGVTEDDMDNISGFPRSIAGVKIAATLRQETPERIKLSVRALPSCDASAICAKLGGGGHKGAAGASLHMSMEQAVEAVIAAIPQL